MIQTQIRNAQGDTFQTAIAMISGINPEGVLTGSISLSSDYNSYKSELTSTPHTLKYDVIYWSTPQNKSAGKLPYVLTDKTGNGDFTCELDEKMMEVFEKAAGTDVDKMRIVCEYHLQHYVLPNVHA